MKGKALTNAEKHLHDELRQMGCAVCKFITKPDVDEFEPPAIHHIEGKTKHNAHSLVIPLCPTHHQHGTKEHPSIHSNGKHGGKYQFKMTYGVTEYDLMEMCEHELDKPYSSDRE